MAVTLQTDAMYGELCQEVALRGAALNHHLREVLVDKDLLQFWIRIERHLDNLRLTVGVGREVHHAGTWGTLCQIVLLVASQRGHVEALHEVVTLLTVTIDCIIDCARVALLEHGQIEHVLTHEDLLCHADHLVFTVLVEDDDVVEVGAVAHELVFLQTCTYKAVGAVDIEFLVGFCHL